MASLIIYSFPVLVRVIQTSSSYCLQSHEAHFLVERKRLQGLSQQLYALETAFNFR